ncbi:MAG: hypothetical protein LBI84_04860 [Propionibacteriaceae bacterium]|jgi:hypothetical protein|nr:hypothetical protein [Propionibacteriaceae bacterium]
MSGLSFTASAGKHGVDPRDAVYAMLHHVWHRPRFDEPRQPGGVWPDLWIGPQRDGRSPLLEVMAEVRPPDVVVVFHVMPARNKILRLMEGDHGED